MTDLATGIGQAGVRSEQALSWMLKIIHQRLSGMAPFEYSPKRGFVGQAGIEQCWKSGMVCGTGMHGDSSMWISVLVPILLRA